MNLRVSGSVWSSLIFDNVRQEGDKEGFLIGEVSMQVLTNISDSQINKTTQETSVTVISHILCIKPFSFYNRKGQVQQERLQAILKNNYSNVVGWFRCRSGSIPEPSLREITLHHNLRDLLGIPYNTFLFGLFGENCNMNHTTITYYYNFFIFNNRMFCPQKVTIENLGDTAESEYKHGSSTTTETGGSGSYKHILASHKNEMIDKDGYLQGMQGIKKTNEAVHQKMRSLKDSVVETEESVRKLVTDIKMLNRRAVQLQRAPSPKEDDGRPGPSTPKDASPAQKVPDHSVIKEPHEKMDTTENAEGDQSATTSHGQHKKRIPSDSTDPFSILCQDMKASINPSMKSQTNVDNVRDRRKLLAHAKVRIQQNLKESSNSGDEVSSSVSPIKIVKEADTIDQSPSGPSPGTTMKLSECDSDTESDSTQLLDSQQELEPSSSQTF